MTLLVGRDSSSEWELFYEISRRMAHNIGFSPHYPSVIVQARWKLLDNVKVKADLSKTE